MLLFLSIWTKNAQFLLESLIISFLRSFGLLYAITKYAILICSSPSVAEGCTSRTWQAVFQRRAAESAARLTGHSAAKHNQALRHLRGLISAGRLTSSRAHYGNFVPDVMAQYRHHCPLAFQPFMPPAIRWHYLSLALFLPPANGPPARRSATIPVGGM